MKNINLNIRIKLLKKGLIEKPDNFSLLYELVKCYFQQESMEDFDKYSQLAVSHSECSNQFIYEVSLKFFRTQQIDKSLDYLNLLSKPLEKDLIIPKQFLKAQILFKKGKVLKSKELLDDLIVKKDCDEEIQFFAAKVNSLIGDNTEAIRICNQVLIKNAQSARAINVLLSIQEKMHNFDDTLFSEKIIQKYDLGIEKESVDFHNQLNDSLFNEPDWLINPKKYSTIKGDQLGFIHLLENDFVEILIDSFRHKILDYLQRIASLNSPYFNLTFSKLDFDMWAVKLNKSGYQTAHFHPGGWISGVYYTKVPKLNTTKKEGFLEFGTNSLKKGFKSYFSVQPKEGLLVLFPSYLAHRTIPFSNNGQRICISFDVIPVI